MSIKNYLLAAISCLTLASCVEIEMNGKIDDKGAGTVTLTMEGPAGNPLDQNAKPPTQEELNEEAKEKLKTEQAKAKATGIEITDLTMTLKGDKKVEKTVVKFDNLKELNAFFNYKEEGQEDKEEPVTTVSITDKDGAKVFNFKMEVPKQEQNPQQEAMIAGILGDSKITMIWSLPGDISVANQDGKISEDKKTATWSFPVIDLIKKGADLQATYK